MFPCDVMVGRLHFYLFFIWIKVFKNLGEEANPPPDLGMSMYKDVHSLTLLNAEEGGMILRVVGIFKRMKITF